MEWFIIRGWDITLPASSTNPRLGFHTVRGDIDPEDHRFHPRFVGFADLEEGFLIRGWDLILPGWRWLHDSQPIIIQAVGLGCP